MRLRCASRRAKSMTPRRRSPCACSRRRPAPPVPCAPPQRGASIVTMGTPWRTCPGRSIGCASSCGSANGFAAIAAAAAASSRNACRPSPPPGRAARCGWPSAPTPRVLGVDDWALRKGHTYGTILVDLERRQPIALLPDRTAAPVAQWLRDHPGVEVIARDRASAYAEGAKQGAPQATQVADRFPLLQNLREALEAVLTAHAPALNAVNAQQRAQPVPLADGTLAVPVPPPPTPPQAAQQAAQRAAVRQARYDEVWRLHRQGYPIITIAAQVGRSPRTIERYLQMPTWPAPQHRRHYGRSVLNPYKAVLLARWNAGCRTAIQLFRELQAQGYPGSYRRVAAYASRLRQAQGLPPRRQGRRQTLPVVAEPTSQPLTPRRATWLVLRREAQRTEAETQQLTQLRTQSTAVAEAMDLAQDFAALVRQRQPAQLDPWLTRATASTLDALRRFATGLLEDYAAV